MDRLLSSSEAAQLMGITCQAVRKACSQGRLQSLKAIGNGGIQYNISLESLPEVAQVKYWTDKAKAQPHSERRAYLESLLLPEDMARAVARAAGLPRKRGDSAPQPWTSEEFEAQTEWFHKLPQSVQDEAARRAALLQQFECMAVPEGMIKADAASAWAKDKRVCRATLYNWRRMVEHLPEHQWAYGLVSGRRPGNGSGHAKVDIDSRVWAFIRQSWLGQSKPALKPIYRRAKKMAQELGVSIPSYKTIARRTAELPRPVVVLAREGQDALDEMYPPQRRDFSSLAVHETWNSDGRMADVHVRWPDGEVRRPIVVASIELRTRVVAGWAIGKSESAHLVRQALAAGLERTRAIPATAYLDNGRAFASKEITGGQATRNRFKVLPDEMLGMLTMMGTQVIWAKPYNGRAKPIESFWRTLAEAEKRPEFAGAYCGNKPDNRPEEHDVKNAVDVALYEKVLREEIEEYHARAHRGEGMDGKAPSQVYDALIADAVVRRPTAEQIRRCKLAAQQATLNRHGEISVLDNRYGNDTSAGLPRGSYTVYYDPNDAAASIELWDGGKFVATLPLIAKTGFADRNAAQDHARAKNTFKRAAREQIKAMHAMDKAADWTAPRQPEPAPAALLPRPTVVKLVHLGKRRAAIPDTSDLPEFTPEELDAIRAKGERVRFGGMR